MGNVTNEEFERLEQKVNSAIVDADDKISNLQSEASIAEENLSKKASKEALESAVSAQSKTDAAQNEEIGKKASKKELESKASKDELAKAVSDLESKIAGSSDSNAAEASEMIQKAIAKQAEFDATQSEAIEANKAEIERTRKDAEENFQTSVARDEEIKAAMNAKDMELEDKINATEEARAYMDELTGAAVDANTNAIKAHAEAIEANTKDDVARANRQAATDNSQNEAIKSNELKDKAQDAKIFDLNSTDSDVYYRIGKLNSRIEALEKKCSKVAIVGRMSVAITLSIIGATIIALCL